jgi:hypothetical protein
MQNAQFKILSPKGHDYLQSKSSQFLALKGTNQQSPITNKKSSRSCFFFTDVARVAGR